MSGHYAEPAARQGRRTKNDLVNPAQGLVDFKLRFNFDFTSTALYSQPKITEMFMYTLNMYIDMGKIEF
jgi:hypothetical protein